MKERCAGFVLRPPARATGRVGFVIRPPARATGRVLWELRHDRGSGPVSVGVCVQINWKLEVREIGPV